MKRSTLSAPNLIHLHFISLLFLFFRIIPIMAGIFIPAIIINYRILVKIPEETMKGIKTIGTDFL